MIIVVDIFALLFIIILVVTLLFQADTDHYDCVDTASLHLLANAETHPFIL